MSYRVQSCYKEHTTRDLCEFYEGNWNGGTVLSKIEFAQWQFNRPPAAMGLNHSVVVVNEKKQIVAAMGLSPRPYVDRRGALHTAAELTSWVVNERHRGQGLAKQMLNFIQKNYACVIGMNITSSALKVYLKAGFYYQGAIPRSVLLLSRKGIEFCTDASEEFHPLLMRNLKLVENILEITEFEAEYFDEFPEEVAVKGSVKNGFKKGIEYIKWRYNEHPAFSYKYLQIRDLVNSDVGTFVLRFWQCENGLKVCHIIDFFASTNRTSRFLFLLTSYLRDKELDIVDYYSTDQSDHIELQRFGWLPVFNYPQIKIAHLFMPFCFREPYSNSLIVWKNTELLMSEGLDILISRGECDFDRPTKVIENLHN